MRAVRVVRHGEPSTAIEVQDDVEVPEPGPGQVRVTVAAASLNFGDIARCRGGVAAELSATGGYAVYELLAERMPPLDDTLHNERLALITGFILRTVADRARASERAQPGRVQLPTELFVRNLVTMAAGMATAPPIDVKTPS